MTWQTNIKEEFEEEEILEGVPEGVQAYKSVKSLLSNSYIFVIMSIPHSFLLGCFIIDWCFLCVMDTRCL